MADIEYGAVLIFETPEGYGIYAKKNEAGGRTYFSDEVGGGVFVWDTALVSRTTLECVIELEEKENASSV